MGGHHSQVRESTVGSNASLHSLVALPCIVTQLLFLKVMFHECRGLNPAVTLVGGWGSANEKGSRWPPECYCSMDAGRLYATANAQGLSATFETGPWAMCSPNVLTLSWPDRS